MIRTFSGARVRVLTGAFAAAFTLLVCGAFPAGLASASSDGWQVKTVQNGTSAVAEGQAKTPDGPAKASLSFTCVPGKGGTSSIEFIVQGANNMKGFPFDAFEGPDAPAANLSLITFTVHRAAGDLVVKSGCSGFYGGSDVPDDAFTFEIASVLKNRQRTVAQVSNALIQGATSISIKITGYKQPGKVVEATFPADGAAAAVGQVMKGCRGR
ncbi:MAG TPA: hypothetical protein VEZ90_16145 [Blastocatellia bacterium]|nr:hypothetical protein [Blastocatellia bacterium]